MKNYYTTSNCKINAKEDDHEVIVTMVDGKIASVSHESKGNCNDIFSANRGDPHFIECLSCVAECMICDNMNVFRAFMREISTTDIEYYMYCRTILQDKLLREISKYKLW